MIFDNKEVEFSVNFASLMVRERGTLQPMVIGIDDGGKRHVIPLAFHNDIDKEMKVAKAKEFFRKLGVTAIVWMSEAWCKKIDQKDARKPFPRPSECPDRVEIVVVSYLSRSEQIYVSMEMKRDGKRVSLGTPEVMMDSFQDNLWGDYFYDKLV